MNNRKPILLTIILLTLISACNTTDTKQRKSGGLLEGLSSNNNIRIGAAINPDLLEIKEYRNTVINNFNFLTPENVMKWEIIHPERNKYDFTASDKLVDFAEKNSMLVRGHTLLWHYQNPTWLTQGNFSREELINILEDHIKTVVGRYKGRIAVWDVVNEGIEGASYRNTIWYKSIGPEYIEMAFKWAHEADPEAKLSYNDYSIGQISLKSDRVYSMVQDLLSKKVPITGVGFQLHMDLNSSYDFASLYNNVDRFTKLGLHVDFTEIDIRIPGEATDDLLKKQAKYYKNLLEILMAYDNSNYFTIWGVTDAHSWIPGYFKGYDNALIFDKEYNPKPAHKSLYDVITKGPSKLNYAPISDSKSRIIIPNFLAYETEELPIIDGNPNDKVWGNGITYPFGFNQLKELKLLINESSTDIFGEWEILYNKNKIYGRVKITDDKIVTTASDSWENDNIELFFNLDKTWAQLRTIVGKDFEPHNYTGLRKAVWSTDNSVLEFEVEMPTDNLKGQISGWNIALSDNDGNNTRDGQYYPLNGINKGWEGKGFGNIQFVGDSPKPPQEPNVVKPFIAIPVTDTFIIDGDLSESNWNNTYEYSLFYNQLNSKNQLPNSNYDDFSSSFSLTYSKDTLYGYVKKSDDIDSELDRVELALKLGDEKVYLSSLIGKKLLSSSKYEIKSAWNNDNSVLEFQIKLTEEKLNPFFIGFNIAVSDYDNDDFAEYKLYPITGSNKISEITELGEVLLNKD